ncbi:hypothetical protein O0I10_011446 [Lichtheimia ornata]|uniref:Uncharacterized protein n=1 Tax=Lichtheimia ornata TaxID=688661 RepID=A0AAD7XWR6_9FUNG|nr:uncharacterized protein O0I10_011446 [Lichtheimia ornata]KAJ8652912.1 hypothetical protein O0I10_011446 [Lichtheimia ornata]
MTQLTTTIATHLLTIQQRVNEDSQRLCPCSTFNAVDRQQPVSKRSLFHGILQQHIVDDIQPLYSFNNDTHYRFMLLLPRLLSTGRPFIKHNVLSHACQVWMQQRFRFSLLMLEYTVRLHDAITLIVDDATLSTGAGTREETLECVPDMVPWEKKSYIDIPTI